MKFLPIPFWCYMLPMLANSMGWLPRESPLYTFASKQILPVCLVLLLIGTDLRTLARMGTAATRIMLAGTLGTMAGGLAAFTLYRKWLPSGSWGAVGALAGSWIGGSANLLAVKEALGVPDSLIGPVILVDALVAYSWMALLIAASGWQDRWDRTLGQGSCREGAGPGAARIGETSRGVWVEPASEAERAGFRPDRPSPLPFRSEPESEADDRARRLAGPPSVRRNPPPRAGFALFLGVLLSLLAQGIANRLPALPGLTASTWTVMLVTTVALGLSATPLRQWGGEPASSWGKVLLYFLLITIGARADLHAVAQAPAFLALGITWILIHGAVLAAAGLFWRTPLGLMATASQANIGGVISAPMVGATYAPELAGLGLLMALLGNVLGTYLGLVTAWLARGSAF